MRSRHDQLALLIPSRGRRASLDRLIASFDATHSGCAHMLVRNGERDAELSTYDDLAHAHLSRIVATDDGFNGWPTAGYCFAMQDLYARHPGYAAYSMMEDDCTLVTPGWDALILDAFDAFPNRIGLIQWQVDAITVLAASREWCSALGYFMARSLREHAWHGLLALSTGRRAPGPALAHHPQARGLYRNDCGFAAMDPAVVALYREDCDHYTRWTTSDEYYADLRTLENATCLPLAR